MLVIILGLTLSVLDSSIVNLALPAIARELQASSALTLWVVNAYQLAALVLLLPSTVFLMWLLFHPPLFVYDVFMVKAPVVLVLFP